MNAPLVRRSPTHRGTVLASAAVTPRMRRVTIQADAMLGVEIKPAQDVELHLQEADGRRVKRRYTIRHARPESGQLDLDIVLHGDGPGSAWGATARAGDEIEFQGPRGKLELRRAPLHLLVGDESALPAFAVIAASLPEDEAAAAIIEIHDATEEQPIDAPVRWVHRGAHPTGTPDLLLPAVADLDLSGSIHAYLLGETRSMVALRAHLEGRGVAHDAIFVKGYWNIGRPDRIAGRTPGMIGT